MTHTELEQQAAKLLLATENPLHFPTHIKKIAHHLNATIVKANLKGESGYIMQYKDNYLIVIDTKNHRVTHSRFTIAHELAHIALGHLTTRQNLSHYEKEHEANYMAAAILMPFHFMVAYRDYETRILSCLMAVSEEAINRRRKDIQKDPKYHIAIEKNYYKENIVKDLRDH